MHMQSAQSISWVDSWLMVAAGAWVAWEGSPLKETSLSYMFFAQGQVVGTCIPIQERTMD